MDTVSSAVPALFAPRVGHFALESGHHGPLWLDLDAVSARPAAVRPLADALARRLAAHDPEVVCGPLAGGGFLAQAVAEELGLPAAWSERHEAPGGPVRYTLPPALREGLRGRRVALVDDAINAGSAARATLAAVRSGGARPVVLGALLTLGDGATALAVAEGIPLEALAAAPGVLWEPTACPRCAEGVPLEDLRPGIEA